jgi:hypothetical protein
MYLQTEIPTRGSWVAWLATMIVGEVKVADPKDRNRIATSISSAFHKKKLARFTIKINKNDRSELHITRIA